MTSPRIIVLGSVNMDLVVRVPHLPAPGETVTGGAYETSPGGKGANQAVAAARAGAKVMFLGAVGDDAHGRVLRGGLRGAGVNVRHLLKRKNAPTGVALIFVGENGENQIAVARGANDTLKPSDVNALESVLPTAKCLVAQLEIPLPVVRRAIDLAHRAGVPVILNPAPAPTKPLPVALLRRVTFLTPNEMELAALTGRTVSSHRQIEAAAGELRARGITHVLATCGADGVCWCGPDRVQWFPAAKVKAIDTVGAGDCFTGAFAAAFAGGRAVPDAIRFANAAAGIAVTRRGAQAAMPTRAEIMHALTP